jgi:hypothetical protein
MADIPCDQMPLRVVLQPDSQQRDRLSLHTFQSLKQVQVQLSQGMK